MLTIIFLYPRIVGGMMKVDPITIMVLLLLSSNIHGVLGMIVAIPTYSIFKEIAEFLVNRYDNHKETQQQKKNEEFGNRLIPESRYQKIRRKKVLPSYFHYVFNPVFLVEKNKKTTTAKLVAAKALSFHFFFLVESICSGKTKGKKKWLKPVAVYHIPNGCANILSSLPPSIAEKSFTTK